MAVKPPYVFVTHFSQSDTTNRNLTYTISNGARQAILLRLGAFVKNFQYVAYHHKCSVQNQSDTGLRPFITADEHKDYSLSPGFRMVLNMNAP